MCAFADPAAQAPVAPLAVDRAVERPACCFVTKNPLGLERLEILLEEERASLGSIVEPRGEWAGREPPVARAKERLYGLGAQVVEPQIPYSGPADRVGAHARERMPVVDEAGVVGDHERETLPLRVSAMRAITSVDGASIQCASSTTTTSGSSAETCWSAAATSDASSACCVSWLPPSA